MLVIGIGVTTAACVVIVIVTHVTLTLVWLLFPVGRDGGAAASGPLSHWNCSLLQLLSIAVSFNP